MGIAAGYEKSVVGSDGEEEGLILAMEGRMCGCCRQQRRRRYSQPM